MYTGLIDHGGVVIAITKTKKGYRVTIRCQFQDLSLGESIAVNGVCLTVVEILDECFVVDISPETLARSNLHFLDKGNVVNLERCLRLNDRLMGHLVQGHVDGMVTVIAINPLAEYHEIHFSLHGELAKNFIIPKGSVALNGISLTINEVTEDSFSCMIIPHTFKITNLNLLNVGDKVNIEYDYFVKTLFNFYQQNKGII